MTLVRDDATSLYEQIATTLREEIEQGCTNRPASCRPRRS